MSETNQQIVTTVIAVILMLLFLAVLFIIMLLYYNSKKKQTVKEKQFMKNIFEKQLLQSQLEIQEQTFSNISQEIHDNVGQILSLAKVQINIMNESELMNRDTLEEVKLNISKAITDLRDIAKSMSSERIRAMSVPAAVENEAERINKSGVLHVQVSSSGTEIKMNEQKKLILFRIIQESLQNIIKHADASLILITFTYLHNELSVTIADNGKGFDPDEAVKKNTGLGLLNIRTRTSLTGGTCSIRSILNEGTSITIQMPYE